MLNFYVRHGMIVEKIRKTISLNQSEYLEKKSKTKKRIDAETACGKDFRN